MTTYRKARSMPAHEAAYIAGMVDGEGTITLTRKHRQENRQLALTIASTERGLLDHIKQCTGVGKITNKKNSRKQHKPSYTYAVYNRQALQILAQIQPYLRSYKSRRGELVLKEYVRLTPRNGRYSGQIKSERDLFESRFLSIKP